METKHTQVPWFTDRIDPKNTVQFMIDQPLGRGQANAAFIVRAVNCHEGLLQTLKMISSLNPVLFDTIMVKQWVDEALAKAEDKS